MAKIGVFVCLLIVVIDVVAGILSIEEEIAQNKVKHMRLRSSACKEPSHDAFKLGLAAAALLALAHITTNLLGGCMCICSPEEIEKSSIHRQLSFSCLIFSWITVAIGFPMLIIGMLENSKSRGSCGITHHHFLSIGGILCFVHGLFCIAFYIAATASIKVENTNGNGAHP
ncbi:hypothetical protein L1049_000794 [Liquidambar formosana]|uniref:Uncharacterized protein n=1 Tax=Liquidambar formosana TaxID=63359 RepID=A0AAP0R7Z1_LIQFO